MVSTAAQSSSESGMTKTTAGMSTTSDDHHAEHSAAADGRAGGTSGTHAANPQHNEDAGYIDDDYAEEEEGKDSYSITTIPGRSSKTVWSEPAHKSSTRSAAADADAADASVTHSLHSGRSLSSARSSRSIAGTGGGSSKNGGRAASMLARARLTATTSAGSCSMRSVHVPMAQQAKSASASGSGSGGITTRTTRARSFDQHEEEEEEVGIDLHVLPTSSGEYYEEYSTSLNDVSDGHGNDRGGRLMDSVKLDGAPDDNNNSSSSSGADQSNSSLNEVDKARMELWGVAARNANNTSSNNAPGTATAARSEEQIQILVPKKQPHQAGQGTSESRDREHQQQQHQQVDSSRFYVSPPPPSEMSSSPQQQQQQQRPQEYTPQRLNPLAVLFSQAQSLGQKAYDRGQKSYRNLQSLRQGYGYDDGANNGRQRDDDDYYGNDEDDEEAGGGGGGGGGGGPATNQPEITGGYHGQSHESFFNGAAAADATSYLSDMCSLLIVLIQAPFLWLYFVVTGRDYHDIYGNVNLQQTSEGIYGGVDATTSQSTFASRTSKMSAEEKQERSEVYLEAKDEDGALFAMLAFHHPGLSPLVDETVDNVALTQVLGEDTGKTGHTDLAAALNPDGMVLNDSSDDDDSSGTGEFDARSVGSAGLSEAFGGGGVDASRSGRSRNSRSSRSRSRHRSKSRARSTSVGARLRRNRDDDEWEYDITTQKMKRKRKKRGRRRDRSKSVSRRDSLTGSVGSFDARSFGGGLNLEDELMSTRSGDLTMASAHSEPPKVIGGVTTKGSSWGGGVRRGRRRGSANSSDQTARRRSSSAEGQRAIAKFKAAIEKKGGIKSVADEWEARGKTSDMDRAAWKSSSDMDDIMAITMNIGDVPSPHVQPVSQRPDGRKGLGMKSFRKVQDTLRKSTRSISSHDGAQVNHDEDVVRPITDIV